MSKVTLVISKDPKRGERRYLVNKEKEKEVDCFGERREAVHLDHLVPRSPGMVQKQPFSDWYHDHYEHVVSIRKLIVDRLSGNAHIRFSINVASDDALAWFLYNTSSCAAKNYKFFK